MSRRDDISSADTAAVTHGNFSKLDRNIVTPIEKGEVGSDKGPWKPPELLS
ncbi:hypothetical protein PC116_g29247 [Phytophthora cactorum]|nr:hypothetical protein PC116_g29247 [Phytophthora cactorum]